MAKRLSSFFSLSRDDKDHADGPQSPPPLNPQSPNYPVTPTFHKLHKHRATASSELDLQSDLPPLAPPPFLSESGVVRPPSSQFSGQDSRPGSRTGSPQSQVQSREGSRSRPQTPSLLIPPGAAVSPARPGTPTSTKITKKKSWHPGKPEKHKFDDGHTPKAWIAGLKEYVAYDLNPLLRGERVSMITTGKNQFY